MKHIIYTTTLWFLCLTTQAQLKTLTLEDAVNKRNTDLAPSRLSQLMWIPNSNSFSWIVKDENKKEVMLTSQASKSKVDTVLKIANLYESLLKVNPDAKPMSRFPFITWITSSSFRFLYAQTYYIYNISDKTTIKTFSIPNTSEDIELQEKTQRLSYIDGKSLKVNTFLGENIYTITPEREGIVVGKAVHRNEFGINKGVFWSPKGNYMAYYYMDESMVTTYPIVNLDTVPSIPKMIRYPMAGDKSHQVTIKILGTRMKINRDVTLSTGEPVEQYLTNIAWSNDEKSIFIAVVNREQNHMWLKEFDMATGQYMRTLLEETNDKYVEPLKPMLFLKNNAEHFIWQSEKDGYNHLYLHNRDGTIVRQLTKGSWVVTDVYGIDSKNEFIYFQATKESAIERHIYKVAIKNGEITRLDEEVGTHTAVFNEQMTYFFDSYSNTSTPRKIHIRSNKGKSTQLLHEAINPLKDFAMPSLQFFTIKASDSTDLYCRIIKPSHFDAQKKYPVMVYVYGGPHAQMINNQWLGGADLWMHQLAEEGYIVFTLDNRGSDNRGRDFEQATFRHLGNIEMEDQLKGVEWLKSQPYIDANRMVVNGWSFGGFMTTSLMLRKPDVFKVGVCGGPVIDWRMYEIMYTERYMDTPKENPEGYREANVLNYIKNLKGNLLVIHGTADDVVLWEHSLKLVKESVSNGIQLDYFVYPEHLHNVSGADRAHLIKKMVTYMKDKLK